MPPENKLVSQLARETGITEQTLYYWYMMLDVFSRKIVGHTSLSEGLAGRPLVLHSDNGSPMKGATMLATLEHLGVAA